jgi:NosR/NirI family transcriptional regulator, nitrous oxide reductase regulator
MRFCVVLFACFAFSAGPAYVQTIHGGMPPFIERLTPDVVAGVFRSVNRVELLKDDGPIAVAAFIDENLVGYIFSTLDVLRAPGYSSTPFDIIAGVTLDGRITGATVLFHREPYLLNDARRTEKLYLESLIIRLLY